jgi:glycosyltransferase involved in cell wall biosynthesis
MRVLIISCIYPTPEAPKVVGGAEIFVRRFAEHLLQNGDCVEVVRAASKAGQQMEECNGIRVHSAPVYNIYRPFTTHWSAPIRGIWHAIEDWQRTAALVSERVRAFKPDVMHSNNLSGLTTAVWRSAWEQGIPIAHTLHDYYLTCPRCSRFSMGHACQHTCLGCRVLTVNRRRVADSVNAVVGVSQRILDIHTELGLFADTPIRAVIRNASTLTSPAGTTGRPAGPITLGFIGRLTEEKGIYNLARAVASLPGDAFRLLIAGRASESEQKRIRALAPEAHIEFLGFVAPAEFYKQVDVVVVPSIWEDPGPLVVADALAAGKPFLGTPFGGIPETIARGGAGWMSNPDPESLTMCIQKILADPRQFQDMSRRASAEVDRWTFPEVVAAYRKVFERIAQPQGAASQ